MGKRVQYADDARGQGSNGCEQNAVLQLEPAHRTAPDRGRPVGRLAGRPGGFCIPGQPWRAIWTFISASSKPALQLIREQSG